MSTSSHAHGEDNYEFQVQKFPTICLIEKEKTIA